MKLMKLMQEGRRLRRVDVSSHFALFLLILGLYYLPNGNSLSAESLQRYDHNEKKKATQPMHNLHPTASLT
jgi:hypothetical protein